MPSNIRGAQVSEAVAHCYAEDDKCKTKRTVWVFATDEKVLKFINYFHLILSPYSDNLLTPILYPASLYLHTP